MKKVNTVILGALICCLSTIGISQNDSLIGHRKMYEYYPNGALKKKTSYLENKLDGPTIEYSIKGNVLYSIYFEKGIPMNDTVFLRDNDNKLISEILLKDGKLDGTSKEYYNSGQLHKEVTYKQGYLTDTVKIYSKKGKLISFATFKDGLINGSYMFCAKKSTVFEYALDGRLIKVREYFSKGVLVSKDLLDEEKQVYYANLDVKKGVTALFSSPMLSKYIVFSGLIIPDILANNF